MKLEEFEERIVNDILRQCRDVLVERGAQYADKDDFLKNFKREAARKSTLGFQFNGEPLRPEHVALWFADTKVDRWANRLRLGKDPSDDYVDGINYILLGAGCHLEYDEEYPSVIKDPGMYITVNLPIKPEYHDALMECFDEDEDVEYLGNGKIRLKMY